MELSELLEEHSIKSINKRTKISENNIHALSQANFSSLKKIKCLGFISILEREYNIDLKSLRNSVNEYYGADFEEDNLSLNIPANHNKGNSKLFFFIIIGLIGYVTWHFLSKYDQSKLENLIPSFDTNLSVVPNEIDQNVSSVEENKDILDIATALQQADKPVKKPEVVAEAEVALPDANVTDTNASEVAENIVANAETENDNNVKTSASITKNEEIVEDEVNDTSISIKVEDLTPKTAESIQLVPDRKLWFGMIDMTTKKRKNSSISKAFDINVKDTQWLIATSAAPFSIVFQDKTQEYNDGRAHYFKLTKEGIMHVSKADYISMGGYKKW